MTDPRRPMTVTDTLRWRVADGTYQPGDAFPSVTAIAVEFGCARNTAWRAVRRLVDEGLVTVRDRSGAHVADPLPVRTHTGDTAPVDIREAIAAALERAAAEIRRIPGGTR